MATADDTTATAAGGSSPITGSVPTATRTVTPTSGALSNALQVYNNLAVAEADVRLAAAASLVNSLVTQQRAFDAAMGSKGKKSASTGSKKGKKDDNDDAAPSSSLWCADVTYALKRLVRGLASSRVSARQGFALALTEVLLALPIIDTSSVVAAADKHITLAQSGASRQEKKDFYFGRIFIALVLARSQRVRQLSSERVVSTVKELLSYAHATPLIRELAFETIVAIIEQLYFIDVKTHLLPTLLPLFEGKDVNELSPELLSLALALDASFRRAKDNRKELPEFLHDLLSAKNLPKLATPLAESSYVHPRVHAVWNRLAVRLSLDEADDIASEPSTPTPIDNNNDTDASESKRSKSRKATTSSSVNGNGNGNGSGAVERATAKWNRFWITLVDDNLFGSDSITKKYLGFQLLELFINQFTNSASPTSSPSSSTPVTSSSSLSPAIIARIRTMFSPRFFRVLMNHAPSHTRTLYKAATSVRECLVTVSTRVPSSSLPILQSLVSESRQFDRRTRSKTVASLISLLAPNDVMSYVTYLLDTFNGITMTKMREIIMRQAVARKQFEEKNVETTNKEKIAKAKGKDATAADDEDKDVVDTSDAAVSQRVDAERGWALEQLAVVLKAQRTAACATPTPVWATAILELFFFHSYFPSFSSSTHTPLPVPSLANMTTAASKGSEVAPTKLVEICRARLATALDSLLPIRLPKLNTKSAAIAAAGSSDGSTGSKKRKAGDDDETSTPSSDSHEDFPSPWALYHIHDYWLSLTDNGYKLVTPLSGDAVNVQPIFTATLSSIRAKVAKKSDKLAKKKSVKADRAEVSVKKDEVERYRALEALSMYLSFLQLSEPDVAAPLEELLGCYEERFGSGRPTKRVTKKAADSDDDEDKDDERASFGERLVDLLLSLLVRSDSTLRDLARFTFGAFTADLTGPAVDLLLDILEKKELKDGEEDTGDFEPIDEEEAAASRARAAAAEDNSDDDEEKEKKSSSSKKGSDDSDDDDDSKDIKLDMAALGKLLGGNLVEDSDSDDDSNSGKDKPKKDAATLQAEFDAEDEKLQSIVNLRKEQRDKAKALKRESVHFKLRVCDLLETLLKRLPHLPPITDGLPMAFRLFLPLLDALSAANEQTELQRRLTSIYKDQLCKAVLIPKIAFPAAAVADKKGAKKSKKETKEASDDDETPVEAEAGSVPIGNIRVVMSALMSRAARTKERDILAIINHALLFLTRVSTPFYGAYQTPVKKTKGSNGAASSSDATTGVASSNEEEQGAFVVSLYRESLIQYLGTKHTLWNTKFFVDFIERCRSLAWRLAPTLVEYTIKAPNSFLSGEAWTLLTGMLKHKSAVSHHTSIIVPLLPSLVKAVEATPIDIAEVAAKKAEAKKEKEKAAAAAVPSKKGKKAAAAVEGDGTPTTNGTSSMDEEEDGASGKKKQENIKPLVKRWRALLRALKGVSDHLNRVNDDTSRATLFPSSMKTAIERLSLPMAILLRVDIIAVYRATSWEFKWDGLDAVVTPKGKKGKESKKGKAKVAAATVTDNDTSAPVKDDVKAQVSQKIVNKQATKAKKPTTKDDSKESKSQAKTPKSSSKASSATPVTEKSEKKAKKDKPATAAATSSDGNGNGSVAVVKKKKPTRRGGAKTDASLKNGKQAKKDGSAKRKEPATATPSLSTAASDATPTGETLSASSSVKKSKKAKTTQ